MMIIIPRSTNWINYISSNKDHSNLYNIESSLYNGIRTRTIVCKISN